MTVAHHELTVSRLIDAPVASVWRAWTEHLEEWWCPKPWTTEILEVDMRPGGRCAMIMRGPEGEDDGGPMEGIFLEVTPERRIVFTNVMNAEWQPQNSPVANMIGWFEFEPEGDKTRYRAGARHWDEAAMQHHDQLGFSDGWGVVAEQLEAVARRITETADA
jgi:uncharacterized protein YndB with AHSA1/START domain